MGDENKHEDRWPPDRYDAEWQTFKRSRPLPTNMERPGPGQESVWDYPRPPRCDAVPARVRVQFAGVVIADSARAVRVCETASPPCYYVPPDDVRTDCLTPAGLQTLCEWKGTARYWTVRVGEKESVNAAWSYPDPESGFEEIRDYIAFYASRVDACFVGDDQVTPQPGDFYGGWITPNLVGPFKGAPDTEAW